MMFVLSNITEGVQLIVQELFTILEHPVFDRFNVIFLQTFDGRSFLLLNGKYICTYIL
jgi:cellulose biosynthesis protein BcsQ